MSAAEAVDANRVLTVAVTSTPRVFEASRLAFARFRYIRTALGLHPLVAAAEQFQLGSFRRQLATTTFIGEVGLDCSPAGKGTFPVQERIFREILRTLVGSGKFVSIHSRGAESRVLDLLSEFNIGPVALHWFTGTTRQAEAAVSAGHYLSINPRMVRSRSGLSLLDSLPRNRALTETDAPYAARVPTDVSIVVRALANAWHCEPQEAKNQVASNFRAILARDQKSTESPR
jgi:TatD DNase family protein